MDRDRAPPLLVPRWDRGAARDRPAHRARREGRAGRAERRGQVDVHAAPQRDPSAHPRLCAGGGVERGRPRRPATAASRGRARLPGSRRSALQPHGLRRRRLRPAPPRHGGRRDPRASRARVGLGRDERVRAAAAVTPLDRPAQARGACHGPLDGPVGPRLRRAVGGARSRGADASSSGCCGASSRR